MVSSNNWLIFLSILSLLTLVVQKAEGQQGSNLENLLLSRDSAFFSKYFEKEAGYEVQLIYGTIDRSDSRPTISHSSYNLHDEYFYPASSIKLPVAVLSLEWLNQMGISGLDMHSRLEHGQAKPEQSAAKRDSSSKTGYPSVAHYARKIFLYSDNDAYNRLFELLGQRYINERLSVLGMKEPRILHRVGIGGFGPEENRWSNPVSFFAGDSLVYHRGSARTAYQSSWQPKNQLRGKAFYKDDELINQPMDFSQKNYISLESLLGVLERVILPGAFHKSERFRLSEAQYRLLWKAMGQYPKESEYPDLADMEDGYVKFYLNGGAGKRVGENIRIFNKVGFAYGYLTDVAYIADLESGIEFFVGGVIHVNKNRTFNDNVYEYDEEGLPFLKRVGEVLLEYEREKNIKREPLKIKKYKEAIFEE